MLERKGLKILDWLVHSAHQYELAKTGHSFYYVQDTIEYPWKFNIRPQPANAKFITQYDPDDFDIIITHNANQIRQIKAWKELGMLSKDKPIIFMFHFCPNNSDDEKTFMQELVKGCYLVFNSYECQKQWDMNNDSQRTIIHGFDIDEWPRWKGGINKVLSVGGRIGDRYHVSGYKLWEKVADIIGHDRVFIMGSHWDKMKAWEKEIVRLSDSWQDLKSTLQNHDVYFSPTKESPFPRARSEAFLTGMPMVTTPNHNANLFIEHGINGFIAEEKEECVFFLKLLLNNSDLRQKFSKNAREKAEVVFNGRRYRREWNNFLEWILYDNRKLYREAL